MGEAAELRPLGTGLGDGGRSYLAGALGVLVNPDVGPVLDAAPHGARLVSRERVAHVRVRVEHVRPQEERPLTGCKAEKFGAGAGAGRERHCLLLRLAVCVQW